MSAAAALEPIVIAAGAQPPARFRALFEACFELSFDERWWRWKYGAARNPSVALVDGDRIIGHYGGVCRDLRMFGKHVAGVQVGDVMVHPQARGSLGRRGSFYRMAVEFLSQEVGYGRPSLLAFGFPHQRALKLGETLGLYAAVDRVTELRWTARATDVPPLRRLDPATTQDAATIDHLWRQMGDDLGEFIAGVRDARWWQHRYRQHPNAHYTVWLVQSDPPVALVCRAHADALEWIDFVGPLAALPAARNAARTLAWATGRPSVFAWLASALAIRLRGADEQERDLKVGVPTCAHTPGPSIETLRGRWLLMGGDTDFR